jgi:hypothetical protein
MTTYVFSGAVYTREKDGSLSRMETEVTIEAPDEETAKEVIMRYGMESVTYEGVRVDD